MKKLQVPDGVSRAFHKVGFKLKKHSPEILVGAGIVGGVASAIMACKATLKVDEVVEKHEAKVEKIHTAVETGVTEAGKEYTVEDSKKDLTIVYVQTGVDFAKLYGPAVVLGTVSIASILAGHGILRKRNAAIMAAYTALDKGFKEYRGRVKERFGEALDNELRYGLKAKEYDEIVVNEDGSETVNKNVVEVMDPISNPFSVFFDESCPGFTPNAEYNKKFLIDQETWLNRKLKNKGFIVVNEVYDALGIPRTTAGCVGGWIYDKTKPANYKQIDLGIFDGNRESVRNFVNGYETVILLNPNAERNIYEMM